MIAHLHNREKALEPFGWKDREAEVGSLGLFAQRRVHQSAILSFFECPP